MSAIEGTVYALHIVGLEDDQIDLTSAMLGYLDVEAIEELDDAINVYSDNADHIKRLHEGVLELCSWLGEDQVSTSERPKENWNEQWESNFQPIRVGDFCLIRASFHEELGEEIKHVITIDPEMAFGTGHHETTYSMIQMMEEIDFEGTTVLDYGCGTGILAILAEKMGATDLMAIDYDPIAIECAENCLNINETTAIQCATMTIDQLPADAQYNVILANINRNVLLTTAAQVRSHQKEGGSLLLSGLLLSDIDMVLAEYEKQDYALVKKIERGEWACLLLR